MKLVVVLVLIVVVGCSRTSHPTVRSDGQYDRKGTTGPKPTGILHLHATWTEPWCGGMEPDPGQWQHNTPWSGVMYIRMAKPDSTGRFAFNDLALPVLDSIRTEGAGHGYLKLEQGTYLLLDRDRIDRIRHDQLLRDFAKPSPYQDAVDKDCLKQWLHGPFGAITIVPGDTSHVELPLHGQCPWYSNPCVNYHGPLPP